MKIFKTLLKYFGVATLALSLVVGVFAVGFPVEVKADAVDLYWHPVGDGTGNWSDVNNWCTAADGTGRGHAAPTSTNNVFFTNQSFNAVGQTVTVDATANCLSMDWTGSTNTPTLAANNQLIVRGSDTYIAAMVVNGTNSVVHRGTGTLTTNGLTVGCIFTFTTGSVVTLGGNFTSTSSISFPLGSLSTSVSNYAITCTGISDSGGASAKTLTLGSSIINCTSWSFGSGGLTLTANTSVINCSGNFSGGGLTTYNTVNLTGATSTITGNNTFATLGFTSAGVQTITFTDGTTQTVSNLTRDAGTSIKTLQGSGAAGWGITYAGATYVSQDYFSISRSNALPAVNKFYAGTHSTNGGNNTGWNFYAPDVPTVTIQAQTTVNCFAVTGNGTITNLGAGNFAATMTGFRWGLITGVYPNDIQQAGAYPLGAFTEAISSLPYHTQIFMQAEAQNSVGWGYSAELTFTTPFVGSPTNFTATAVGNRIDLAWVAGLYSTSTMIIRGVHSYPTAITDGSIVYSGALLVFSDTLISDPDFNQYFYSAFGVVTTNISPTYSTATNGGVVMVALVGFAVLGILGLFGAGLMIGGFALKKALLGVMSALFWIAFGVYSYTASTKDWTSWDIFLALCFGGLFIAIAAMFSAVSMREKAETLEEVMQPTGMMAFQQEMEDMNNQLHVMNRPPQERKRAPDTDALGKLIERKKREKGG